MINGIIVRTNNTVERFEGTLEDMQAIVGGWVEIVRPRSFKDALGGKAVMCVDEEGLLKDRDTNIVGSIIYNSGLRYMNSRIVGDIILCKTEKVRGKNDFTVCTEDELAYFESFAKTLIERI